MANTPWQDDRFYNPTKIKKVFAIASVVMMVVTVWMILDDFGREWKGYQREFLQIKQKKYAAQAEAAKKAIDPAALAESKKGVDDAQGEIKAHEKEIERLQKELVLLKTKSKNTLVKYQARKANLDAERFDYENEWGHAIAEGHIETLPAKGQKQYDALMKGFSDTQALQEMSNQALQTFEAKQKEYDEHFEKKKEAEKKLVALQAEYVRLQALEEGSEFGLTKVVRASPVIDLADPVFRLQQVVLTDIRDDLFFAQTRKVDRCTTCHQAIDLPGFENQPNPFKTHPRLEVMLGSTSPHPLDKIGCTICHDGRGQATHFVRAAHTPRNEEQAHEWKRKYGWNEEDQHHIPEKMVPLQYVEGKCRVCHREQEYVYRAPKLDRSVQMVRFAGCFGCHKIAGWEHVEKTAPSLLKVKGKLSRDWILKWIHNPKDFNEHTRMPSPFLQSNTVGNPEFESYQEAEMQAVTDYLLAKSEDYRPYARAGAGSVERGKTLVSQVGCLGCHQIDDFGHKIGRWNAGPDLSTVGSKVDRDWLVSWVKNPTHYRPDTRMPNLRLSDGEANDITAYLMSKRNTAFEAKAVPKVDPEVQKKVLRLYLLRDPKMAPVTESKVSDYIGKLSSHDLSVELGSRSIGQYGCFGCHNIKGYETMGGIGPELSEEWSKPLGKYDFGLQHFDHTKIAWFDHKLENPRLFDKGLVKDYLDLLRMPNFNLPKEERDQFITFLTGMTAEKPAPKVLSSRERKMEQGRRVIHKYNCQGCHVMEELWEPLPSDHPDFDANEAAKFRLEARILYQYEEDEAYGPPKIPHEGFRIQPDWVHGFLKNPQDWKLRQALKVRMPTFNFNWTERNSLLDGWGNEAEVPYPLVENAPVHLNSTDLKNAQVLFTKLQCLNCHNLGEKLTQDQLEGGSKGFAPNLRYAARRLRKEWMIEFLKNPNKWVPGTRMPGFWVDGAKPVPEILGGDAEKQINLLIDYVITLGQNSAPSKAE